MNRHRAVWLGGLTLCVLAGSNGCGSAAERAPISDEEVCFKDSFESGELAGWEREGGRIDVISHGAGRACRIVSASLDGSAFLTRQLPLERLRGRRVFVHCRYRLTDFEVSTKRYSGVRVTLAHAEADTGKKRWPGGPLFEVTDPKQWTDCRILVDLVHKVENTRLRIGFQRARGTLLVEEIRVTTTSRTPEPKTNEAVVDNRDPGFVSRGDWHVSVEAPGLWGTDCLWHAKGAGEATATWTHVAPQSGRWELGARWPRGLPGGADRATDARFEITFPGGRKEVRVNMADEAQAGRFNPLTVVDLKEGQAALVTLTGGADNAVVADATRLVRLPDGCGGSELLYENTFRAAPAAWQRESAQDWVMEGGGVVEVKDGRLRLRASHFTPTRSRTETDHLVYWLKREFPADFVVEWDFRFPDKSVCPNGLAIIFICARGSRGEDLFDPALATRDGVFARYIKGDIDSYHVSYFAGSRGRANARKNSGFNLVMAGEDLVAKAGPDAWHRLRLVRFGSELELSVNGLRCLTYDDDGQTYGPVHGGGKIGLRQQNDLYWGDYTNLRVYALR